MIHIGWFAEVMLSTLPVGHTHVDIDQVFSTFAKYQKHHSLEFITDCINALPVAYPSADTRPLANFLPEVYNWVGFLSMFVKDISGIFNGHAFLMRKTTNNKVGLKFKSYHSADVQWTGTADAPEEWAILCDEFPAGSPTVIDPQPIPDMITPEIIKKYAPYMSKKSLHKWEDFFEEGHIDEEYVFPLDVDMWNYKKVSNIITILD